jgi:hypothetical protein
MNDNTDYKEFLNQKKITVKPSGFDVGLDDINPMLFEFQRDIVRWALRKGKAALFEDCGLGKTPQQLEWARLVSEHTGKPVIIFAPLAVANQTQKEGDKFGIPVNICATQADVINAQVDNLNIELDEIEYSDDPPKITSGVNITNYQKLHHFKTHDENGDPIWGGIVLDESSILKGLAS